MSQVKQTPFHAAHKQAGARMVDFSGWQLPLHYGSQIKEHEAVRSDAGMFDVSHMLITDVSGSEAKAWLQKLLANDVAKLKVVGKALYSPMLNEQGGVMDDLIVYRLNEAEDQYRIVSNAATRDKDAQHFHKVAIDFDVHLKPRTDLAMLAVQGPRALMKLFEAKPQWQEAVAALTVFQGVDLGLNWFVARTGYTGEEGVEVMLPTAQAESFFSDLHSRGVRPCGLGARDTLRLEAGMNLYGHDMDEQTSPLVAGMAWTVAMKDKRDFIGRQALEKQQSQGIDLQQVGLVLAGGGILRDGMEVIMPSGAKGVITSGSFSPTLKQSVAMARVPKESAASAQVIIRGNPVQVRLLPLPFVRHGQVQFDA